MQALRGGEDLQERRPSWLLSENVRNQKSFDALGFLGFWGFLDALLVKCWPQRRIELDHFREFRGTKFESLGREGGKMEQNMVTVMGGSWKEDDVPEHDI